MAIRITIEVGVDRLREAEMKTTDGELRAATEAPTDGSQLSRQNREHWMPVRNPRIRARLDLASEAAFAAH